MRLVAATLTMVLCASAAAAEVPGDVQALAEAYAQKKNEFTAYVEYVFFAAGCGVFKTNLPARQLTAVHAQAFIRWMVANSIPQLGGDVRVSAELAGRKRAASPGECAYWRRAPEEILRLQREAEAASIY